MTEQLNILDAIDRAKARRDTGIERVGNKAGAEWKAAALDRLRLYLRVRGGLPFLAEEFSGWSIIQGFRKPHDARAWGAVIQAAARRGLIHRVGYAAAKSSNMSPKCLWQRKF